MSAFLFERDFDQEIEEESLSDSLPQGPIGPDPVMLEAIRREAYEAGLAQGHSQGLEEGRTEMRDSLMARETQTLEGLMPLLQVITQDQARHRKQLETDLARLTLALAQKLLPEVRALYGDRRLTAFAKRAVHLAQGSGSLQLTLSPQMHAQLAPRLSPLGPMQITADPDFAPLEAKAHWPQGAAHYAEEKLHDALLSTLHSIAQDLPADGN